MKTSEARGKDKITNSAQRASPEVGNNAPGRLHAIIAQQPFFRGMSGHHLQLLADSAMEIKFERGHLIYQQGDIANSALHRSLDGHVDECVLHPA
jgi:hypothetical protein